MFFFQAVTMQMFVLKCSILNCPRVQGNLSINTALYCLFYHIWSYEAVVMTMSGQLPDRLGYTKIHLDMLSNHIATA